MKPPTLHILIFCLLCFTPLLLKAQVDTIAKQKRIPLDSKHIFWDIDGFLLTDGWNSSGYFNATLGYQFHPSLAVGIHYNSIAPRAPSHSYSGVGVSGRFKYRFFQLRANLGLLTNYTRTSGNGGTCLYEYELKTHAYMNLWTGFSIFRVLRIGALLAYVPPSFEADGYCGTADILARRITYTEKISIWSIHPSIGVTIPFILLKSN